MRVARVNTGWTTKVRPHLPANYDIIGRGLQAHDAQTIIAGYDELGVDLEFVIRTLERKGLEVTEITRAEFTVSDGRDPHA